MSNHSEFDRLLDMLQVLKEIDLALAPIIPTERMCQAGAQVAGISPADAKRVYTVMLMNMTHISEEHSAITH